MTDQECMECGLSAAGAASAAAWDAELAERDKSIIAASNAADKAEQNHKRCIAQVESLRRELSKMTAEAGRLREALVIVSSSADDCMLSHGENLCCIREAGLVRIAEAALSPEPEKPAPDGEAKLSAVTAENKRMREALMKWRDDLEPYQEYIDANGIYRLVSEILSPYTEKPAPEVKP